ncbi:hypothetical protein KY290_001586 [Solanum tuberosum]|uniref:Uncharacterized protein n=1 Tax=Solanum tuberosum TaxID=4113 RepID=A0ABQ7WMM9_SOLTU|nr:hypothetical protein KY290_001586 [Solanum tuberosum]
MDMNSVEWIQMIHIADPYCDCGLRFVSDDKVTVLEAEKRAWENSPEAKAVRDALNPWRHQDAEASKDS